MRIVERQKKLYDEIIEKYINSDPRYVWFTQGFDSKKVGAMKKYYKDRYNHKVEYPPPHPIVPLSLPTRGAIRRPFLFYIPGTPYLIIR